MGRFHAVVDDARRRGGRRSLLPNVPYDPDRDFQAIARYYYTPNLLAVTLSLPVKSVRELIDYARKNPGVLLYGSSGTGTTFHLGRGRQARGGQGRVMEGGGRRNLRTPFRLDCCRLSPINRPFPTRT